MPGRNPAVVLDHCRNRARLAGEHDADVPRTRVLDDVRERLLDDAVERCLDFGRKALRRQPRLEAYPDSRLRAEALRQALERRDEAEVVEHLRPQLDREPAHVVQRRDHELADVGHREAGPVGLDLLLERLQAEQDRRKRLPRLVVQLAREPAPLELLGVDDAPKRVAGNALGKVDGDRRAGCERLRKADVVVGETRVAAELVVDGDQADRRGANDERHPEPRPRTEAANDIVIDVRIVQHRVAPLAAAEVEDAAALRGCPPHRPAEEALTALTGDRREPQLGVADGKHHRDDAGVEQLPQPPRDEVEEPLDVGLGRERVADLVQRLELPRPLRRSLVEPSVLDRDRRLRGEQRDDFLVVLGEVLAARLLGQVEVAVGDPAQQDRHAEKRVHRRMVRREPDRARVVARGREAAAASLR